MKYFLGTEEINFSEKELLDSYINEGTEGITYKYKNSAIKIYSNTYPYKPKLSEEEIFRMSKIPTKRILMPEKPLYDENEFDHHLKVALRELALEEVRIKKYPNYPSRLSSLYVSKTLEEAEKWYKLFIELGRPTYSIVKVEVDGNEFIGDAQNCFDGTKDKNKNMELAEYYWKNEGNFKGKDPIIEIIVDGKIKVIDIIK